MEKTMEEKEKSLFLSKVLVSDTDGAKSDTVIKNSLQTLHPDHWLNDELICFYLRHCLRKQDEALLNKQKVLKRSHFFNTHFWQTLHDQYNHDLGVKDKYNYENMKRWSKNIPGKNIFDLERIFVPINLGNLHWVLGVIHIEKMIIELLDSKIGTEMLDFLASILRSNIHVYFPNKKEAGQYSFLQQYGEQYQNIIFLAFHPFELDVDVTETQTR
jgi:Ulp1 family protease